MSRICPITKLPKLTENNLALIMSERILATKTDKTVIPMLWQGLLELNIPVNGQERTTKYYIPKDTTQGTAIVIMNVPEGEQTLSFLEKSGWIERADEEGFCLFVLEPDADAWKTPEEEAPYLQAGFKAELLGQYCLTAFAAYVVGYGSIGAELHKIVMTDPLHVAATVFLDAGSVDEDYRKQYESKYYNIPDRFAPEVNSLRVPYREVPVPVWFVSQTIDDQTEAMIRYWKSAAKAEALHEDAVCGKVYSQCGSTIYTPEGNILKVAVQACGLNYCSCDTTKAIYDFLKQYYRYGMGPCSNAVSKRVDFNAIGVEHRHFTDSNGIDREYLVYIPTAYRGGKKKLPMVVGYHGASQSMRNMMANGMWYEIADREGIIMVYPESTLVPILPELAGGVSFAYRPLWSLHSDNCRTEIVYANELLDRLIAEFPVDESRIYCTGHSMGCMMTNYLGSDLISHRFAAMGATSGCLRVRETAGTQPIPVFMTIGQFDLWSYLLSDEGPVSAEIDMWLVRDGFASEENVRQVRSSPSEIYKEGNYNNYVWKDANGTPWVRYAWISNKHHVHTPDESHTFWNQWFSRWYIDEGGNRCYR